MDTITNDRDHVVDNLNALRETHAWVSEILNPLPLAAPKKANAPAQRRPAASYRGARRNQYHAEQRSARSLRDTRRSFGLSKSQYDRVRALAASINRRATEPQRIAA